MNNNNEELKAILDGFLESFNKKISNISKYEDILIKEADMLKNMYQKMFENSITIEKLIKQFESEKYVFFRDFRENISDAIKEGLTGTLNNKSISFTLIDIENHKDPIHEYLKKRLEEIEINVINKLSNITKEGMKQGK